MNRNFFITVACLAAALFFLAGDLRGDAEAAAEGWKLIDEGALVIDVRSDEEFNAGHLDGALHIPYDQVDEIARAIGEDRQRDVVMYCGSGRRVGIAIDALEEQGYENLFNATGLSALQAARPQWAGRPDAETPADCRTGC
jgi:phage shock protein E